ncbi:hypothetical protein [Levilactobacillus brevis]|uniref:hypothetical protein n=1 Tax=Levilactobacillus brevis TaxID=1580 RepID=UPI0035A2BE3A
MDSEQTGGATARWWTVNNTIINTNNIATIEDKNNDGVEIRLTNGNVLNVPVDFETFINVINS